MSRFLKALTLMLALLLPLSLLSCTGRGERTVGSCGAYEITYDELCYRVTAYKSGHPEHTEAELRQGVADSIRRHAAIRLLCAERLPDMNEEDETVRSAVEAAIKQAKESMGKGSAWKDYLAEQGLTEPLMHRLLAVTQLQIELEAKLFAGTELASKDALLTWLDGGNYVRAKRICLPLTDADGNSLFGLAEALRDSLRAGSSPDTLLTADQKALGAELRAAGYYFRGLNGTAEETAALSLAPGGVSDILTDATGYTIFVRVDNDRETLVSYQLQPLLESYRSAYLDELLAPIEAELSVIWNDEGDALVFSELK